MEYWFQGGEDIYQLSCNLRFQGRQRIQQKKKLLSLILQSETIQQNSADYDKMDPKLHRWGPALQHLQYVLVSSIKGPFPFTHL